MPFVVLAAIFALLESGPQILPHAGTVLTRSPQTAAKRRNKPLNVASLTLLNVSWRTGSDQAISEHTMRIAAKETWRF
jgi:hypothetical protein